ncbi:MAG: hypothetical protein F9K40_17665 [Kofleriaceae bacterium]|nr:MAG: hypothetical protein F9K40_17665 [Kofleriaceae bacterium]MBZ0232293.1 hypothetical protein [Kofleriaceae bacterium]
MRSLLCALALLVPTVATAEVADDRVPGTRPYLVDATIGFRSGETMGWNARLFAGGVPWGNLVPSRRDRSVYLALGGQAGAGRLALTQRRTTWSVGPEVRTGIAWGGRSRLLAHAYVAVSPMVVHIESDPMLPGSDYRAGLRVAMGLSAPAIRRGSLSAAAAIITKEEHYDYGSASSSVASYALIGRTFLGIAALVFPDTVELTYERTAGNEWTGIAVGYSL